MSDYKHSFSLSLISELIYKNKYEIQLLINYLTMILLINYLTMILNPKNKAKKLNLSLVPSLVNSLPSISKKKWGAPLISTTWPRKRGFGHENAAWIWPHPGGDIGSVWFHPLLSGWICYWSLVLIWSSMILKPTDLDSYKSESTDFIWFDPPWYTLIFRWNHLYPLEYLSPL